jgi:DNA-binding NarL/FixJ family response regulator
MTVRVLIVDDHAVMRDGLRALLEAQPKLEVVGSVGDGYQALRAIKDTRPDVVLMDIAMPRLNGIEATRHIVEANPQIRVVILSMHATAEHIYRAFRAGAKGYLLKESAGQNVVEAVRAVHAGKLYLCAKVTAAMVGSYVTNPPEVSPLDSLSGRERQILQLAAEGWSSAQIGAQLTLSPKTVDTYRSRLMNKLKINDLPNLVKFAIQHGLIPLD